MNVLAHLYLSGQDKEVLVGNYLGDFVRSSQHSQFSSSVQFGIQLHHKIDTYTDAHPQVMETKQILRKAFSKYASVVVDIYFDHFLALHWCRYHDEQLESFAQKCYAILGLHEEGFPTKAQRFFAYLESNNVLQGYRNFDQLSQVFLGMSRRASFKSNMEQGVAELEKNYQEIETLFTAFFNDLGHYVDSENPHFRYGK